MTSWFAVKGELEECPDAETGCGHVFHVVMDQDYDALEARLREADALLRRALPDLQWAERAAYSEWDVPLDDPDIIRDIEAFIAAPSDAAPESP